ncbi:AAA family ATPase [Photobacterium sanguinicancri]|uniref:AAA family ATPase n=1 Tax=Photobacterium sanguinicancri TaxID=875932 RepID=A0AAW7Y7M5_9GAMM|nr:AAA family ATPase [Photobacterium sanguinicancri]MDO6542898.1 AAA family ATPase [Photobacterium sanguinicancri]
MNLDNLFKSSSNKGKSGIKEQDLIISESADIISSIEEMYAIEGFSKPIFSKDMKEDFWSDKSLKIRNVIIDLRDKDHINETISELSTKLNVDISIIVIGNYDSIKLKSQLMALGANYVLWDSELNELLSAILSVTGKKVATENKKTRIAKRILILASKGGVGLSTISSLLCYALAKESNLKTLMVDHDSGALNADMFLGIKGLKVRQESNDLTNREVDNAIAKTYLSKSIDKLDYLMLEKNPEISSCHSETLYNLSNTLVDEYNFIIDSMSLSSFDELDKATFQERYHRVFIVCEQSVSSLRSYNLIKKRIDKLEHKIVFSQTRPAKDYVIPLDNAKVRIKQKESIDVFYESGLEKVFVHKGPDGVMETKFSDPIREILSILTGKTIQRKRKFKLFNK